MDKTGQQRPWKHRILAPARTPAARTYRPAALPPLLVPLLSALDETAARETLSGEEDPHTRRREPDDARAGGAVRR